MRESKEGKGFKASFIIKSKGLGFIKINGN